MHAGQSDRDRQTDEVLQLLRALRLQALIWRLWGEQIRLDEVEEIGLEGLVTEKLWSLEEEADGEGDALVSEVDRCVRPVLTEFGRDMDDSLVRRIAAPRTALHHPPNSHTEEMSESHFS